MSAIQHVWPGANRRPEEPNVLRRWFTFCLVGGLGILVQLSTLAALTIEVGMHYLPATALAVEGAVLHNFLWHEHWTWSDRSRQDKPGWWKRLWRFQIANGALSISGNLVLMQLFVRLWNMNYSLANILSIALCSILNFLASDRVVFPRPPHEDRLDFTSLAPLGERVARNRRRHQPGRDG